MLRTLQENKLYAKFSKLEFWLREANFMGHFISTKGIKVEPDKIKVVLDRNPPKNVIEVRIFLGFVSYNKRFVNEFAMLETPLTCLLRKKEKFELIKVCQKIFDKLKVILTKTLILA